jgi:hypothetical protein
MIRLYSPNQVACAAFFGGPLATVYVLWRNFRSLGNFPSETQSLIWGALFILALLGILPFLPEKFPNLVIPITYTIAARQMAETYQLSKQAIRESEQYRFHSNWNVFGISVGFLLVFFVLAVALLFGLAALGILRI